MDPEVRYYLVRQEFKIHLLRVLDMAREHKDKELEQKVMKILEEEFGIKEVVKV